MVQVKADIKDVIAKFPKEVQDRYDFGQAIYRGGGQRMEGILCPKHGFFTQYPSQLRKNGAGCPQCGDVVRRAKQRLPVDTFIERAQKLHGGKYSYEYTVYTVSSAKLTVTCFEHGNFEVTPNNHLRGRGCPVCGALSRGKRKDPVAAAQKTSATKIARFADSFILRAREIHGDAYDYSKTDYQGMNTKIVITCPKHGDFEQKPWHHLEREHGCPQCSHHRSKAEADILDFVSIFSEPKSRVRNVVPPKELDIYVPEAKLAIEYCGEYWHGADCEEDEPFARRRHADKYEACQSKGIRLLTVFGTEWAERPAVIKRLIRNALGKGRGSVMARKCDLRRVSHPNAAAFFERYHPQGGGGTGDSYGLYYKGKLVACMRFSLGTNDRGAAATRTWTLSRYATRISVPGGASKLFAAFLKDHNPPLVKTFSDNRYFTGAMYEQLGFKLADTSDPDYQVWHQRLGLLPKSAWQRRNIPNIIRKLGGPERFDPVNDPRTEREMTFLLGAQRVYDCGKKRWLWEPDAN